ncbi:MAG TPA: DsbA family protein [Solirubrobacteraceae bacterium]|jgi:2-hydroxychromene-2-carboxylate isomerase
MSSIVFFYDLGSPYAYLSAERLPRILPGSVRWQPVLLGGIFALTGRGSWAMGEPAEREQGIAEIERRARAYDLPPLRWPEPWPSDYLGAMRAATYAYDVGLGHEFTMHAFHEAFQRGQDLALAETVLRVGAEVGMSESDLEAALADPAVKRALRDATDAAHVAGVMGVPSVVVEGEVFWGDDRLEDAARVAGVSH